VLVAKQALPRISVLCAMPEIQALRYSMGSKLIPFLDANPEAFVVNRPEGTAQNMSVTVHPSFVPGPVPSPASTTHTHQHQQQQQQSHSTWAQAAAAETYVYPPTTPVKGKGKGKKGKGKGGYFNADDSAAKRVKTE